MSARSTAAAGRFTRSLHILSAGVLLLTVAYCVFWPDLSDRVRRDLEGKATGRSESATVGAYDYVCFSAVTGRATQEFGPDLAKRDNQYAELANACGVDHTCCNLDSDSDYAGLVKDGTVRCVRVKYALLTEREQSLCIPPAKIKVTRETFLSRFHSSNKAWTVEAGSHYLMISETP
ncbi:MAG: hypothetical protein K2Z80_04610 [Xanthobacteraceae bacterium]|nr:hypothetical protein [Xanthobacteraceae bacterium]